MPPSRSNQEEQCKQAHDPVAKDVARDVRADDQAHPEQHDEKSEHRISFHARLKARGPAGEAAATRSGLVSQSDADSERTAPPGHGAQAVEAQPGLDRTAVHEEMR
jgi:hypothetical protein